MQYALCYVGAEKLKYFNAYICVRPYNKMYVIICERYL